MRKTISKTYKRRLWLTVFSAIMIVAAIAVLSVTVFTERSAPDKTAGAAVLTSWNVSSNGNYELNSGITVTASSARTNSLSNVTIDGKGYTITINGNGNLYDQTRSGGESLYAGILFGSVNGLTLKNVTINYNATVSFTGRNNASRPSDTSSDAASRSTILYAGIIAGSMTGTNTFENVTLNMTSSSRFAAIGIDNGGNGEKEFGPGQGTAAGFIAGSLTGTTEIKGMSFTNDGLIHSRAASKNIGDTYTYGIFGNTVVPLLKDTDRVTSNAGGLFGVIGAYSTESSGTLNAENLEILGSGAVGTYTNLDGNPENMSKVCLDYSGGLVGRVLKGSVDLEDLYYRAGLQIYGSRGLSAAKLLVGSGTASLDGIWFNPDNGTVKSSRWNSAWNSNTEQTLGSLNKPANVSGSSFNGYSSFGIDGATGIRSYNTTVKYEGSKNVSGYSMDITGFARNSGAITDYMNLEITLGNTADVILSYVEKNGSVTRDYFEEKLNNNKKITITDFIDDKINSSNNTAQFEVMLADTYTINYGNIGKTDNRNGDVTYAGTSPGVPHELSLVPVSGSTTEGWEIDYRWKSEHFFINSAGEYYLNEDGTPEQKNYTYTETIGDEVILHEGTDTGNPYYDTYSVFGSNAITTSPYAGIYRVSLVDNAGNAPASGALVARNTNKTAFYYFDDSSDYLQYKILRRKLMVEPVTDAPEITKTYDGTNEVPSSSIIAGTHYSTMRINDDNTQSPGVYSNDDTRVGLEMTEGGFSGVNVGAAAVNVKFRISDTSDYVQVDDTGKPTSEEISLNINGRIDKRALMVTYGESSLVYLGQNVAPTPSVKGFYLYGIDETEDLYIRLKDEIAGLFSGGGYVVETFSEHSEAANRIAEFNNAYGEGGSVSEKTTVSPFNVGTNYCVMVMLEPETYNSCNFSIRSTEGGNFAYFNIVKREVAIDWKAMSGQLSKTYNGQENTFTIAPIWKAVDGADNTGIADPDKDEDFKYTVTYFNNDDPDDKGTDSGVKNAGEYTAKVALGSEGIAQNYVLAGELSGTLVVEKADLKVNYSITGFNNGNYLDGDSTSIVYAHLASQFTNVSSRNDYDLTELVKVEFETNPDNIKADNSNPYTANVILTYTKNGTAGDITMWDVGDYRLSVAWSSSYSSAEEGGANYNLVYAEHEFIITPLELEYDDIDESALTAEYSGTAPSFPTPGNNANALDRLDFTKKYYYYSENAAGNNRGEEIANPGSITDAGKYIMAYSLNSNVSPYSTNYQDDPKDYVFEITPFDIENNSFGRFVIDLYNLSYQYRGQGEEVELEFGKDYIITFNRNNQPASNYIISYENNVDISTDENPAKMIIVANNPNFTGTVTRKFTITPRTINVRIYYTGDDGAPEIVSNRGRVTHVYDGRDMSKEKRFSAELYYTETDAEGKIVEVILPDSEATPEIVFEDKAAVNVGTYTVRSAFSEPDGKNNYRAETLPTCTLAITERRLSVNVSAPGDEYTEVTTANGKNFNVVYNGTDRTLVVTVGNTAEGESFTASVSFRDYENNYYNESVISEETANVGTYLLRIEVTPGENTLEDNYDFAETENVSGTNYQLKVEKRSVQLVLSVAEDASGEMTLNEETATFSTTYSASSKDGLITWRMSDNNAEDEGVIEGDKLTVSLTYRDSDGIQISSPINAGSYVIDVGNANSNANYSVTIEKMTSGARELDWRLEIERAPLKVTVIQSTYERGDDTGNGKIYDGLEYSSRYSRFTFEYDGAMSEGDLSTFDGAFVYTFYKDEISDANKLSSAPSDAGHYRVRILWNPSSAPANNYRLDREGGLSYIDEEFTILTRYIGVSFGDNAESFYNAASQIREANASTLVGDNNSGVISGQAVNLVTVALTVVDGKVVVTPVDENYNGSVNTGTYYFSGYLDEEVYPNYEIAPGALATTIEIENGTYDLPSFEGHSLAAPEVLTISAFGYTFQENDFKDSIVWSKQYGDSDGALMEFDFEVLQGEILRLRLVREEGDSVGSYGITGIEIVGKYTDDGLVIVNVRENYSLGVQCTTKFNITKREVVYDLSNYVVQVDYDGTIYISNESNIPSEDHTGYVWPEVGKEPFNIRYDLSDINGKNYELNFALIPDADRGVSDAGWYNIKPVVLMSDTDSESFNVTLASDNLEKFRIKPQTINFTLGTVDGVGFDKVGEDKFVYEQVFRFRQSDVGASAGYEDYTFFEEPDYFAFIQIPEKDENGAYWGYKPLDEKYAEWLTIGNDDAEALREIFQRYLRIERVVSSSSTSHYVGEYLIKITVLDESGSENGNFEPESNIQYYFKITEFDLNNAVSDADREALIGIVPKEKTYDGTNYVSNIPMSNNMDKFGAEFVFYYETLHLNFSAVYSDGTGFNAGEGKDIIVTNKFTNSSLSVNNNFILPKPVVIEGEGSILKKDLTVSISDYDTPVELTYGDRLMYDGAVSTYSGYAVSAVFRGFLTGENPDTAGISVSIRFAGTDSVALDAVRDVGSYTIEVVAEYNEGAAQNYNLIFSNHQRAVNVSKRTISIEPTGTIYEKPVNGKTDVPNFYVYNGEIQEDRNSVLNDYFTVTGLVEGQDANLRIGYNIAMSTAEVSDNAYVIISNIVLYTGDDELTPNPNYALDSASVVQIKAKVHSLGTVTLNQETGGTITFVYSNTPVNVGLTTNLLDIDGYNVTAELRYSGAQGTGTVYPVDTSDPNYSDRYSLLAPTNAGDYVIEIWLNIKGVGVNEDMEPFSSHQRDVSLKITKAKPTIVFSRQDATMTYGDFDAETNAISAEVYFLADEKIPSQAVKVNYSFALADGTLPENPPVGTHTVTATFEGNSNYQSVSALEASTTLKIVQKKITVSISGTDDLTYSGVDLQDKIVVTFDGVIAGDVCEPVKRLTFGSVAVNEVVNAGQYNVKVSPANTNYVISGPSSKGFTVNKRTLVVTATAPGTHLGESPQFTYDYAGFAEGDTVEDLLHAPTVNLGGVLVGDNTIKPSGGEDPNYQFVYRETILVILQPRAQAEDSEGGGGLSNGATMALIIGGVVVGIALLIVLAYVIKTATYRSMYNVGSIKKKVNEEIKKKSRK